MYLSPHKNVLTAILAQVDLSELTFKQLEYLVTKCVDSASSNVRNQLMIKLKSIDAARLSDSEVI
jgi:hypothetical protein